MYDYTSIYDNIEGNEDEYVTVDYITFRLFIDTIEAVTDGSMTYDYFGFPNCLDYEYKAHMHPYSPLTKEEARSRF